MYILKCENYDANLPKFEVMGHSDSLNDLTDLLENHLKTLDCVINGSHKILGNTKTDNYIVIVNKYNHYNILCCYYFEEHS